MFAMVNADETLPPLGRFLTEQRKIRRWSQNELARQAGLNPGGLSEVVRGISLPETETIYKLAEALSTDPAYLMRLANGESPEPIEVEYHPEAAYIAERLTKLPPELREQAIDAVGGVVDSFSRVAEQMQAAQEPPTLRPTADELLTDNVRRLHARGNRPRTGLEGLDADSEEDEEQEA